MSKHFSEFLSLFEAGRYEKARKALKADRGDRAERAEMAVMPNSSWGHISYEDHISAAIEKSPGKKLTKEGIFQYFIDNISYIRVIKNSTSWKDSITKELRGSKLERRGIKFERRKIFRRVSIDGVSWWGMNVEDDGYDSCSEEKIVRYKTLDEAKLKRLEARRTYLNQKYLRYEDEKWLRKIEDCENKIDDLKQEMNHMYEKQ